MEWIERARKADPKSNGVDGLDILVDEARFRLLGVGLQVFAAEDSIQTAAAELVIETARTLDAITDELRDLRDPSDRSDENGPAVRDFVRRTDCDAECFRGRLDTVQRTIEELREWSAP